MRSRHKTQLSADRAEQLDHQDTADLTFLFLPELKEEIAKFELANNNAYSTQFIQALNNLYAELEASIQKQMDKGYNNFKIYQSAANKIAGETITMLKRFHIKPAPGVSSVAHQNKQLNNLYAYKRKCEQTSWSGYHLRSVGLVVCEAIGCFIGATVGLVLCSPVGPLATVLGINLGLITGGIAGFYLGKLLFFKADEKTKRVNDVWTQGLNYQAQLFSAHNKAQRQLTPTPSQGLSMKTKKNS